MYVDNSTRSTLVLVIGSMKTTDTAEEQNGWLADKETLLRAEAPLQQWKKEMLRR